MKILHIVEKFSLKSGGVRTVVENLHSQLKKRNLDSFVISSLKEEEDEIIIIDTKNTPWLYSKKWIHKFHEINKEKKLDCIHIHGVWMYPQYIAAKFALQNNVPFIISPHGMYEPWLWTKGRTKKTLYFKFLVKQYFSKANAIHAITKREEENLRVLFPKTKIVEIPNLIYKKETINQNLEFNEKYILYIGRLDKIKGIDILIKSFIELNNSEFKLKIAGKINDYAKELQDLIKKYNYKCNNIEFTGFVEGIDKKRLIEKAFVLVAPSHSEVIGMVNLEGAILKTPVITTFHTGLKKDWSNNGGKLINPNKKELKNILKEVYSWSESQRNYNGNKLYNFVVENYSWSKKMHEWIELYKNIK